MGEEGGESFQKLGWGLLLLLQKNSVHPPKWRHFEGQIEKLPFPPHRGGIIAQYQPEFRGNVGRRIFSHPIRHPRRRRRPFLISSDQMVDIPFPCDSDLGTLCDFLQKQILPAAAVFSSSSSSFILTAEKAPLPTLSPFLKWGLGI